MCLVRRSQTRSGLRRFASCAIPGNPIGMRQQFFFDDESERIVAARSRRRLAFSGAPNYTHGGASMAVLDDAMAWAIIELKQRFGVTRANARSTSSVP